MREGQATKQAKTFSKDDEVQQQAIHLAWDLLPPNEVTITPLDSPIDYKPLSPNTTLFTCTNTTTSLDSSDDDLDPFEDDSYPEYDQVVPQMT